MAAFAALPQVFAPSLWTSDVAKHSSAQTVQRRWPTRAGIFRGPRICDDRETGASQIAGVVRAVHNLRNDIGLVTGAKPTIAKGKAGRRFFSRYTPLPINLELS